jgi:4-amino-4-deoxy-L-arabinose transferase-like glycosyltransferase
VNRLNDISGSLLLVVVLLLLYSHVPLGTAFAFSTDESYETLKPFLCNQGHLLYKEIWNDEPPMFTVILASAFKLFGTSILTARLVVVTLAAIFFLVLHDMVADERPICNMHTDIAGMVAAITESDPGFASERTSHNTLG